MSGGKRQFVRSIEKFRRTAEKELVRVSELDERNRAFGKLIDDHPFLAHFADRLVQKRAQLIDDVGWAEQFLEQIQATLIKEEKRKSEKPDKAKRAKADKHRKK